MTTLATWTVVVTAIGSAVVIDAATRAAEARPVSALERPEHLVERGGAVAAPPRLADTGLYADFAAQKISDRVHSFSPQYPLWTDGASKRRWIELPPGTSIDAADPLRWKFPVGTKLWKEFAYGKRVETRFMELTGTGWIFATYVWTEDGSDAVLAPERGVAAAYVKTSGAVRHDIPGLQDCKACHEGRDNAVLGFELLQLSPDRDPLAPHATSSAGDVNLTTLTERGLLRGLPAELIANPPRVAARTPRERAALGYLHGNCSSCHNTSGPLASLGMSLVAPIAGAAPAERGARETAIVVDSHFRLPGTSNTMRRIAPGDPNGSVVVQRMSSRHPIVQMPPLGTSVVDDEAVNLVSRWIRELPQTAIAQTTLSHD